MDEPLVLVLHLDVNKTILLDDPAGGLSPSDICNQLCAINAFGSCTLPPGGGDPVWELASPVLSTTPPAEGLVSYTFFLREILYPFREDSPTDPAERAAKTAFNRRQKALAKAASTCFTEPGKPGATFRPLFDLLRGHLELSAVERASCSAIPGAPSAWRRGSHFVLPCYFRLLSALLARGLRFAVVFRTFGSDLADVIFEHNLFVEGRHPLHALPPATPPEAVASLRVATPHDTGRFLRHGPQSHETHLAVVAGRGAEARVTTVTGFRAIHEHLVDAVAAAAGPAASDTPTPPSLGHARAFALQDDHAYWFSHHETAGAGKLLTLDPSDRTVHPLFCDDNIGTHKDTLRLLPDAVRARLAAAGLRVQEQGPPTSVDADEDAHIVDVRDVRTGESLPFAVTRDVFLACADTLSAVLSDSYLVDLVAHCEARWKAALAVRELSS